MAIPTIQQIDKIIADHSYEGIRDQDGWETLALTVEAEYPQWAPLILDRLFDFDV